jgi:hypothetical protein
VLAGYVWDMENLYVREHETAFKKLVRLIEIEKILSDDSGVEVVV